MNPLIPAVVNTLVESIVNRFFPNASEAKKAQLQIDLQRLVNESELVKGQLEINKAEAEAPNRKYPTFRECIGYVCVAAVTYHLILLPMVVSVMTVFGSTLKIDDFPHIDITQIIKILLGLLGLSSI